MFNSPRNPGKLQESDFDRSFRRTGTFIKVCFVAVIFMVLSTLAVSVFLGVTCYMSNDPNSMACYMMSDRVEVGVRQR